MSKRVLFAGFYHETHTFLDEPTEWEDFEVKTGAEILSKLGDASPTDGFLETMHAAGYEVVPTVDARKFPSGIISDATFERFWTEFESHARPALAEGVDGIFLVLHGAMAVDGFRDPEGEWFERLRALPGAAGLPLFGVYDLHANVSARMCELSNGLVGYRENPHTDSRDSSVRASQLLIRALEGSVVPRMGWCQVPLMWAPPGTATATDPMKALRMFWDEAQAKNPAIWDASVNGGFSFADAPDTGVSMCVIYEGEPGTVRTELEAAAQLAWDRREEGVVDYPSIDEVLSAKPTSDEGPILLVEPADNIGGGGPGDCTGVLRGLLRHSVTNALLALMDHQAVAALQDIEIGATTTLSLGGKGSRLDEGPVELEVTLRSRSDGNYELEDKNSHMASMGGMHVRMGPSAVVEAQGITILLTSVKTPPFDLGQYRSQGIEPTDYAFIGVKAAVAHRRAYDKIMGASYFVDTAGPCRSNLTAFPWQHIRRPIFPLDQINEPEFRIL